MRGLRTWSGKGVVGVRADGAVVEAVVGVGMRSGTLAAGA